jgi:hypothetical protein
LKTDEEGRAASVLFEGLSHTHRKEFCRWIAEAKKGRDTMEEIGESHRDAQERCKDSRGRAADENAGAAVPLGLRYRAGVV